MNVAIILLKAGSAIMMLVLGIHQFVRPADWFGYIPEPIKKAGSPGPVSGEDRALSCETIVRTHAAGNLFFGLFLVSGFIPLIAAWAAFVWWSSVLPLAFMHKWTEGMRDLSIVISLLALIFLLS